MSNANVDVHDDLKILDGDSLNSFKFIQLLVGEECNLNPPPPLSAYNKTPVRHRVCRLFRYFICPLVVHLT